ncbi:MAG: acyl--CoA ligase [Deltaproteobacteria bacterium]|nr:acyl--CoA ligase [Deltaproteobacteria bacterium]
MSRKSFGELLADQARYNPKGIAITYGSRRVGWKELNTKVNRFANALLDLGIKKGDHVIIMFHDCPEFIESNYALQKIGAVPIPMNFRFVAREIEYQTNQSDSIAFIFEDLFSEEVNKARPNLKKVKNYICLAREGKDVPKDILDYEKFIAKYPSTEPPPCTTGGDVCTISYTGGTTGLPKGVVLTYDNFRNLAESIFGDLFSRFVLDPKVNVGRIVDRISPVPGLEGVVNKLLTYPKIRSSVAKSIPQLLPKVYSTPAAPLINRITGGLSMFLNMPLFHMANYQLLITGPMALTPRLIFRTGISFDPKEALEIIDQEEPLMVVLVPTQWKKILDHPDFDKYDKNSVLIAMTGSGINPAAQKKRILQKFPNSLIVDVFGQTEMTPDTSIRIDASEDGLKDRSVGKPVSGIEMRIVNANGEDVPQGEVGEILYRSGTVMKEYYKDSEKTAEVMEGGWFHSGDLGYIDKDGELIVVDRMKETISTGGEKVYPHEVEEIIESHPKVSHVCVIGVPDETWGHTVRAVIELRQGEKATQEEIISWCKDKMTGFKRPKSVIFVDSLPITTVGKVMRGKVKEKYGKPLGQ